MMEIKSFFLVIIKGTNLIKMTGKMVRPPKILGETTGRLTEATAEKLKKRKCLTIHQKKEILRLIRKEEHKDLGYVRLCQLVFSKLGLKISKNTMKRIKADKELVFEIKTSAKTVRTNSISPIYKTFRAQLFDIIHAESARVCISNSMIAKYGKRLQEQAIFQNDEQIQKLTFSPSWIWQYKRDYSITFRRVVGKKFAVDDTAVKECLAKLDEKRTEYDSQPESSQPESSQPDSQIFYSDDF